MNSNILENPDNDNILHGVVVELMDESDDGIHQFIKEISDTEEEAFIGKILKFMKRTPRNSIKNDFEVLVPTYTNEEFMHQV